MARLCVIHPYYLKKKRKQWRNKQREMENALGYYSKKIIWRDQRMTNENTEGEKRE